MFLRVMTVIRVLKQKQKNTEIRNEQQKTGGMKVLRQM